MMIYWSQIAYLWPLLWWWLKNQDFSLFRGKYCQFLIYFSTDKHQICCGVCWNTSQLLFWYLMFGNWLGGTEGPLGGPPIRLKMVNSMWGQWKKQIQWKTCVLLMPHYIAHHSMCKESHSVLYTGVEGSYMVCTKKGKNGKFTLESWIASKKAIQVKFLASSFCY